MADTYQPSSVRFERSRETGTARWWRFLDYARNERGREKGFTLIEIMVALAVFSLAAMALIRLESATIRGAGILDSTLVAQMVARNVAFEAMTDARPPALGQAQGIERNGGRSWAWTRITKPTGDARILRINVAVADAEGNVQGRLTVVRAPTPEAVTATAS
ncbi:type II secretion system minor pseudopilin GspI [Sphingomonas sp. GB1N7]|uniref:type II secretion system minor pseudopilin GspI n=1 Tax=Parasphingomonas caseinilytica TaxID=3096158 RepID=UPI002FC6EB44